MAGSFGWDDLFIFIEYVVSIGFATCAVLGSEQYYLDRHTWDVPMDAYVPAAKNGWIAQMLFIISSGATKVSILMFYRRMTQGTYNVRWRYAIWAALAFTFGFVAALLISYCLICRPLDSYWLSYDFSYTKEYKCLNGNALTPLTGTLSITSDLYATILPWCMLYKYNLDVPRKQKIALNIIFSLSLIVAGCGGGRLYYLWKINNSYDTSWTGYDLFVWSLLECPLAIIFACAPSLRAFVRRYLQDPYRTFRSGAESRGANWTKGSISHSGSAMRNSITIKESPVGRLSDIDERVLVKSPEGRITATDDLWSRRSSDTVLPIANAEDYESYNLKRLQ